MEAVNTHLHVKSKYAKLKTNWKR